MPGYPAALVGQHYIGEDAYVNKISINNLNSNSKLNHNINSNCCKLKAI